MNLSELDIGRAAGVLAKHGIETTNDLIALNQRELHALGGMGAKSVAAVLDALAARGLEMAHDPWAPYLCARHGKPGWDVGLADLFLCDACAQDFERDAFDGQLPEWVSSPTGGYCLNCNVEKPDVRIRQWFLCGTCERVVRSIGRSIVAARHVLHVWTDVVGGDAFGFALREVDVPVLKRRSKENIAAKVSQVDFVAYDAADDPVFGIEMKTGKSYVRGASVGSKMGTFQLDESDCDDILAVVRRDRIPVYLAHVQVIDRSFAPTVRYEPLGLWWTDLFAMRDNFVEARTRPRETRIAAYYRTEMFRDVDALTEHLRADGPRQLKDRIESEGVPELYRLA